MLAVSYTHLDVYKRQGEKGGLHLYAFTVNQPINRWDFRGMSPAGMTQAQQTYMAKINAFLQTMRELNYSGNGSDSSMYNLGDNGTIEGFNFAVSNSSGIFDGGVNFSDPNDTSAANTASGAGSGASVPSGNGAPNLSNFNNASLGTTPSTLLSSGPVSSDPVTDATSPTGTTNAPNSAGGNYQALQVTYVGADGNEYTYMPVTTVKNQAQADQLGVPIGATAPIIVPPGQDPQGMINQWTVLGPSDNSANFAATWMPYGPNDYKNLQPPATSIYDAYGNFEYGATGTAAGFTGDQLQDTANLLHTGFIPTGVYPGFMPVPGLNQSPQNTTDIQSGINAVQNGGVVITVPVHYP